MESMPDEVLLQIFNNLDSESLPAAHQVSKRWSNLIETSNPLMKRFQLMMFFTWNNFKVYGMIDNAIHRNITIKMSHGFTKITKDCNEFMQKHCTSIRQATLKNFNQINISIIAPKFENLTKLIVVDFILNADVISSNFVNSSRFVNSSNIVNFPKLQHLELINSIQFLEFLGQHSLKVLKIFKMDEVQDKYRSSGITMASYLLRNLMPNLGHQNLVGILPHIDRNEIIYQEHRRDEFPPNRMRANEFHYPGGIFHYEDPQLQRSMKEKFNVLHGILTNFLKNCVDLEHLTLSTMNNLPEDLEIFSDGVPFKLKSLTIHKIRISDEKLQNFLVNQTKSLKSLVISHSTKSQNILSIIFNRMTLDELEIDLKTIGDVYYHDDNRKSSIKRLILRDFKTKNGRNPSRYRIGVQNADEKIKEVIMACPDVEVLEIYKEINDFHALFLPIPLVKVTTMKLNRPLLIASPAASLENLQHLEIDKIHTEDDFRILFYLTRFTPQLKFLKINKIPNEIFNMDCFTAIIGHLSKLEQFHIKMKCNLSEKILPPLRSVLLANNSIRCVTMIEGSESEENINNYLNLPNKKFKFVVCENPDEFFKKNRKTCKIVQMEKENEARKSRIKKGIKLSKQIYPFHFDDDSSDEDWELSLYR